MAYASSSEGVTRRVFVASDRWKPVVGDFFAGTPGADVTGWVDKLAQTPAVRIGTNSRMSATVVTTSLEGIRDLTLSFQYVNDRGDTQVAFLALRSGGGTPVGRGLTRFDGHIVGCNFACTVQQVDIVGRPKDPGKPEPPLQLVDTMFAGQRPLGEAAGSHLVTHQNGLDVARHGTRLDITMSKFPFTKSFAMATFRDPQAQPAISTGGFQSEIEHGSPTVQGIDGENRKVSVIGSVSALPFVGTVGTLLDLGSGLVGAGGSCPRPMRWCWLERTRRRPSSPLFARPTRWAGPRRMPGCWTGWGRPRVRRGRGCMC